MNEGIKITELPYTDVSKDSDLIPIVQDGVTKTTKKSNLAGKDGISPEISIGAVVTGDPGTFAVVEADTPQDAPEKVILSFVIPQGPFGETPEIKIGKVQSSLPGASPEISLGEGSTKEKPIFDFIIPTGESPKVSGGTVTTVSFDEEAKVSVVETEGVATFNFDIPRGTPPEFTVEKVETVASNEEAKVTIDSTMKESPKISFSIPRGVMPNITLQAAVLEPGSTSRIYMENEGTDSPILHVELAEGPKGEELAWEEYL